MSRIWRHTDESTPPEAGVNGLVDPNPSIFDQFAKREAMRFIEGLSGALSERQQAVLVLRYRDDETFDGIAKRLSITRPSAHQLHARAIEALGKAFAAMRIFHVRDLI